MTKEEALVIAIKAIADHSYCMVGGRPWDEAEELIKLLDELCNDGVLIRADKAGDRNPVGDFNPSYTYLEA